MDIKQLELEEQIRDIVKADNGRTVVFEYVSRPNIEIGQVLIHEQSTQIFNQILTVSTFNQSTKEVTVMYTTKPAESKVVCLQEVLNYLQVIRPTLDTYTVEWRKKGLGQGSQKSYFDGTTIQQVLDKFFAGKKIEEYIIHSIVMSPYGD